MSQQYSQQYLGSKSGKSCGHPTARQIEDNELSDTICLDCLCWKISTLVKNGENGRSKFIPSPNIEPATSVDTVMLDSLAGFVESPTNTNEQNLLFIGALKTILRFVDDTSRDYLVQKFAQVVDCGVTLSAIICQEFIMKDGRCLGIFLEKHRYVLEHLIFKINGAPRQTLPHLYRILKITCTNTREIPSENNSQCSMGWSQEGYNIIFPHILKVTTDAVGILKKSGDEETIYSCLDFFATIFQNHLVAYLVFHSDITNPLCGVFRNILSTNLPNLQKAIIEILNLILRASNSPKKNGHQNSQYHELKESIPHLIVKADLDLQVYGCLNSNDVDLLNCTMTFFHLLCTKDGFEYERLVPTVELCLRVFGAKLHCDGLNKLEMFSFFSKCLSNMEPVDFALQQLVLSLCKSLIPVTNWHLSDKLYYFKLLRHCKDARAVGPLLEILGCMQTSGTRTIGSLNQKLNIGVDVLNLETNFLQQTLFEHLSELKMISISMRGRDEDDMCVDGHEEYLTGKLRNLSKMFQIIDSKFNETGPEPYLTFPFDLGTNILRVVKKYFSFENIGRFGLEFIISMLKCEQPNCDMGTTIMNDNRFLKFLENLLNFTKTSPEHCYVAYDIMTCLQDGLNKKKYSYKRSIKVEWSMTRIIPFMKYAVTDLDYLKFFVSLLQCNFKSDLVMIPETENECTSPNFGFYIQNVMFNTHNLIFQIVDEEIAVQVWITLTEILKFFDRRIGCSQEPQLKSILRNLVFSASLFNTIETYLFLCKNVETVHTSIIEFFGAWVNLILIIARSSKKIHAVVGEGRPPVLLNLFIWIKEWLKSCIQALSSKGKHPDDQKHSLVVYIYCQAEEVLKIMKMSDENREEIEWETMNNLRF